MPTKLHDEMVQILSMTESTKHPCFIQSSSKPILGANMKEGEKKRLTACLFWQAVTGIHTANTPQ